MLLAFVNVRFTEAWHFHAPVPESASFLKADFHGGNFSQESCSLCHAAHVDVLSFKAFEEFFFLTNFTPLPFLKEVFKTSSALIHTSSRAPPVLF